MIQNRLCMLTILLLHLPAAVIDVSGHMPQKRFCPIVPGLLSIRRSNNCVPMKSLLLSFALICWSGNGLLGQISADFYKAYSTYKEKSITNQRFSPNDIVSIISRPSGFSIVKLGESVEGRPIYQCSIGKGRTKVLLWSQMHGNEPTATMALMDVFNFFNKKDNFDSWRQKILSELTIAFIPVLNPDGTARFERRNALEIDLNRDALRLTSPEAKILKKAKESFDPDWGFNLHDQSRYTGAGHTGQAVSIAMLAPAYDFENNVNEVRKKAMQLVVSINEVLQPYIPGKVARYYDPFEPRAFGDNMQKWGVSTILIESGGLKGDTEKQYLRQLNFVAMLSAFDAIAKRTYATNSLQAYEQIPVNESGSFYDVILREISFEKQGKWYTTDIGIRCNQQDQDEKGAEQFSACTVAEIGDLFFQHAYTDLPAKGWRIRPGTVYDKVLSGDQSLRQIDVLTLLKRGVAFVRIDPMPLNKISAKSPFQLIKAKDNASANLAMGTRSGLVIENNGIITHALINGYFFDLQKDATRIKKMLQDY